MSFKTQKKRPSGLRVNQISGYPLPFIDDVSINGGLNYLALKADPTLEVIVNCGPFLPAVAGDRIDLYWKGSDGIERKVASRTFNVGEIMASFPIPVAVALQAQEGLGVIRYTYTDSAATYPVEPLECLIKTTVPGNPYSAPNQPETIYINEAMLAPTVVPSAIDQGNVGSGATVTIPAWANMFEGDILTLNWGGYAIKQPALTDTQPGQPLVIKVSEADIRAAGNSAEVQVSYEIRDLVNNWSLNSPAALVDVNTDLNLLDAPDVIDVDAGKLDFDALEGGVSLTIVKTPAPIFSVGDGVTLYWKGTNAQGALIEKSYELNVTSTTGRLQFKVPNADVALFIGGSVTSVSYTLGSSFTGELEFSRSLMFAVTGTQLDLPAPQLENGLVGGVFEPVTLPSTGALISLLPYPGMAASDRILLSWEGLDSKGDPLHGSNDQTLELADVDKEFVFVIDKNVYLNVGDGSQLTFSYLVIFSGTGATRNSDEVSYTVKNLTQDIPPAPSVVEAPGDVLNPMNALAGATLRVRYEGMLDSDIIGINWNGDGDFPNLPGNQALGYVDFPIDVPRVAPTVGKTVVAFYSVGRNGGYDISLNLSLTVLDFQDPEVELPSPPITEVVNDTLDLGRFATDAHITVVAWPLISAGQKYWINVTGTAVDGSAYSSIVAAGETLVADEVNSGISRDFLRTELEKFKSTTILKVKMRVLFDPAGNEAQAIAFPLFQTIIEADTWVDSIADFDNGTAGDWTRGPAAVLGVITGQGYFSQNSIDPNYSYAGVVFSRTFTFKAGRTYEFFVQAFNWVGLPGGILPTFTLRRSSVGPITPSIKVAYNEGWKTISAQFTPQEDITESLQVYSEESQGWGGGDVGGNDYYLDNIKVRRIS